MNFELFLVFLILFCSKVTESAVRNRTGRFFPFMAIINIPEYECEKDSNGVARGVCTSAVECGANGGKAIGACNNLAICCQFEIYGTESQNNVNADKRVVTLSNGNNLNSTTFRFQKILLPSHITNFFNNNPLNALSRFGLGPNERFGPSWLSSSSNKVCFVKLDFMSDFHPPISDPNNELRGNCNEERVTISGAPGSFDGESFIVCGKMTGQHMYLEFGDSSEEIKVQVESTRDYTIRATYISCEERIPSGCLQVYKASSGQITSFNYMDADGWQHLNNQVYTVCISKSSGANPSNIGWTTCSNVRKSFNICGNYNEAFEELPRYCSKSCTRDRISIGSETICSSDFPTLNSMSFQEGSRVQINFDKNEQGNTIRVGNCMSATAGEGDYNNMMKVNNDCYWYLKEQESSEISFQLMDSTRNHCPKRVLDLECQETKSSNNVECTCTRPVVPTDENNNGFCLQYTTF